MASQIDDNNLQISDWVLDFLLKKTSLDDQALNSLLTILPLPKTNPSFPKFLLLRKLQSYVSHSSLPESALHLFEQLEETDFRRGVVASKAMKRAYCAVAVQCTIKHWDVEFDYFDCVKRIWRNKIGLMEKVLGKEGGLGSAELWEWREQIEVAAWDNDVRNTLSEKTKGVVNAVEMVTGYLREERAKMAPTFLEMLSDTVKGDSVIKEKLGLGKGGVASVSSVGLDTKKGHEGPKDRRIRDDIVIKENLGLGTAHGDVGDASDRVCLEGKRGNGNEGRKENIQLRKGHKQRPRGIQITDCDDEMDVGPSNAIDSADEIPSMLRARNLMHSVESYDIRVAEAIRKRARGDDNNRIESRIWSKVLNVDSYGVVHHTRSNMSNSVGKSFEETNALPNTSHEHLPSKRVKLGSRLSAKTREAPSDVNKMQGKNVGETDAPSQENWPVNRDKPGSPRPRKLQAPISVQDLESLKGKPKKRWNSVEEDTLRNGVYKFGEGNWKQILMAYGDVFEGRTNVDLKDKWRNMIRSGRS